MRRPPASVLSLLAAGLVAAAAAAGCGGVGGPKPGAPPHHAERGFRNPNPGYAPPGFWVRVRFLARRYFATTFLTPTASLPRVDNDGRALLENRTEATVTWIGHSTLLVQLDGLNILTDPQWAERASPFAWAGPQRVTPPGLRFEDLPPIHLVLVSHDHYDHLDESTVLRLWAAHRPRFLVPLGLRAWLVEHGVTDVEELDWWESRSVGGVTVTSLPAQHWAARSWWDRNRRLWSGWALAGRTRRLYFAGDTGYHPPLFEEIGRRLGPFDLAAIPIGSYAPPAMMRSSHTDPEEALRVLEDVRGRHMVGIHWGTFDLADEPFEEPPARLLAEARRIGLGSERIWVLRHGETRPW